MTNELMSIALDLGAAENSLEHHGIKGQSWGKRNGPPYPLRAGQLSKEEKKENPGGSNEQQKEVLKASGANKKSLMDRISDKHKQHVVEKKRAEAQKKREQTIKAKKQAEIDAANAEQKRREKLYKYSPEELLEHRLEYSNDELSDAISKLKQANELQSVAIDTARRDNDMFAEKLKKDRRGAEKLQTAITYGEKAIKIYDVIATLSGEPTLEQRAGMRLDLMKQEIQSQRNQQNQQNNKAKDDRGLFEKMSDNRQNKEKDRAAKQLDKLVEDYGKAKTDKQSEEARRQMSEILDKERQKLDANRFADLQSTVNSKMSTSQKNRETYKSLTEESTKNTAEYKANVKRAQMEIMQAYEKKAQADPNNPADSRHGAVADIIKRLYSPDDKDFGHITDDQIKDAWATIPKEYLDLFKSNNGKKNPNK